jgi:hypothetical protein
MPSKQSSKVKKGGKFANRGESRRAEPLTVREKARMRERAGERDADDSGISGRTKDPIRSLMDARRSRGKTAPEGQKVIVSSGGMKAGGKVGYKKGGKIDGCAMRGRTRGTMR